MILFFAPFPDASKGDGWMARIMAVDEIFKDRPRAYVYDRQAYTRRHHEGYDIFFKQHDALRQEYILNFSYNRHVRFLSNLISKADFVYAHTAHSAQFMFPYYSTGKVVTDLHGLAALEEDMMGFPARARFFGALEEEMVRHSAILVAVTQSMEHYYQTLYPGLRTPFILNPIRQALPECSDHALVRQPKEKPVVIFAGGCQTWQQPEKMLQVAKELTEKYSFEFYSHNEVAFKKLMDEYQISDSAVHLSYCPREELDLKYKQADFGLVLRADSPVNRVACPTKLIEYMAFGVIPVVDLYEIGDFPSWGYHAITIEDFLAGNLPDIESLNKMRLENYAISHKMNSTCDSGITAIQALTKLPAHVDMQKNAARFLPTIDRMYLAVEPSWYVCSFSGESAAQSACVNDYDFGAEKVTIPLSGEGALTSFVLTLMKKPFATTPIHVQIETADGKVHTVKIEETYQIDKQGNWFFINNPSFCVDLEEPIADVVQIHFTFTLLLSQGEVYMALKQ